MEAHADPGRFRFGAFELDVRSRELRSAGGPVRLQDQPFEILRLMLERPGDVVTREELRRRLWPEGTYVDFEHSLNAAVKRLRAALGDDADNPRYVETLPRRGYRFVAALDATRAAELPQRAAQGPKVRLAVLPFSNLSDDRQEFFSDGLTEELIAQIGGLCRGRVAVLARWSSIAFKGTPLRASEVAETLRADYLIEGTVRHEAGRVRITARLIEAAGETHIWSEVYERSLSDCLAVQSEVAAHIARSLSTELDSERRACAPCNPGAYQAYLKGRYYWNKTADSGLPEAIAYYEDALRAQPTFGPAHASLARAFISRAEYYRDVPRHALAEARVAATRALEIDGGLYEAHLALADTRRMLDWDWAAAEMGYSQAIALNPSYESAHRAYAVMLAARGRSAEAVRESERAIELDPLCLVVGGSAAWVSYVAGDYDAAIEIARNTIDMDPEFIPAHRVLGAAYLQAGLPSKAVAELEGAAARAAGNPVLLAWLAHAKAATGARADAETLLAQALRSPGYVSQYHLAIAYAGLDQIDKAFEALETAWLDRDPALAHACVEPRLEALRGEARFRDLVERMKLPAGEALGLRL